MSVTEGKIQEFVACARTLKEDEKDEAKVFFDRLLQAFGLGGQREAGATLEYRVKGQPKSTKFADLLWRPRLAEVGQNHPMNQEPVIAVHYEPMRRL